MSKTAEIPQHIIDTRYLRDLSARILSIYLFSEDEEGIMKEVAFTLEAAEENRRCDCDPDERGEEEVHGDSDDDDGWFCSYQAVKGQYE